MDQYVDGQQRVDR